MPLSHRQIQEITSLYTRHGRKKSQCCVCEGLRCCSELFAARPDLICYTVLTEAGKRHAGFVSGETFVVGESEMASLSGTVSSQGILSVARCPEEDDMPLSDPFLLALDRIGDPGNFGTICRTARAAGLRSLWYTKGSVDPWGDKAIRSGLGSQFGMKLRSFATLRELAEAAKKEGYGPFCISTPRGGENCFTAPRLFQKDVLVIGSESNGAELLEGSRFVEIPMPGGFESLNAAQAATILLFEAVRRGALQEKGKS